MKRNRALIFAIAAAWAGGILSAQEAVTEGDLEAATEPAGAAATAPAGAAPTQAPSLTPAAPARTGGGRNGRNGGGRNRSSGTFGGGSSRTFVTDSTLPPDYQVLVQKSMFAKDRRPLVEQSATSRPDNNTFTAPPPVEHWPILRGTGEAIGDEGSTGPNAVFEMTDGSHIVLSVGGELEGPQGGTITEIIIDGDDKSVAITQKDGSVHHVKLGQDLAGRDPDNLPTYSSAGSSSGGTATTTSATATPTTGPAINAPVGSGRLPNESVEDYMKRKRREEGLR